MNTNYGYIVKNYRHIETTFSGVTLKFTSSHLHEFSPTRYCRISRYYRPQFVRIIIYYWHYPSNLIRVRRIQRGFAGGQPLWDPKFLSQINKTKNLAILNELSFEHNV